DSVLTHSVDLFKPGVDVQKSILGNPTSVVVGTTITFHFTITNTSDGDLNTPALDDPNNNTPDLIFDSISDPLLGNLTSNVIAAGLNVLDFGETGSFDVNYTVQQKDVPSLTNTVVVHYHPFGFPNDVTDAASVSLAVAPPPSSQLAPTNTTVQQFIAGTAADLTQVNGVVSGNPSTITTSVNPGVFFFFTRFTVTPGAHKLLIDQSASVAGLEFAVSQAPGTSQVNLYSATGTTLPLPTVDISKLSVGDVQMDISGLSVGTTY